MEIEMRPIPPHGPDQEIVRPPHPGFQRMLLYIANEQYENVRNKWTKWMSLQPSPDSGWVQVFEKLPGFRQAVKPGLHPLMRAFWFIVVLLCCIIVYLIIKEGIKRTMGHPLVVSTETEEVGITNIDFPQVTVSHLGGLKLTSILQAHDNDVDARFSANVKTEDGVLWNRNDTGALQQVIDQACSYQTTYAGLNNVENDDNGNTHLYVNSKSYNLMDDPTSQIMTEKIIPFLKKATYNCSDVIAGCFLNEISIPCALLFKKRFSEWGSTCMFNGIPGLVSRRFQTMQTVISEEEYTPNELEAWKEAKLDQDIGQAKPKIIGPVRTPWRQTSAGKTSGLSFIIKDEILDKGCVHGEGKGFMLAVAHPSDEPKIKPFGKSMPFGHEVFISINPILLLADGDIKKMPLDERGCFFSDDKAGANLKYYEKYTKQNCFQECIADAVDAKCHCKGIVNPGDPKRALCDTYHSTKCAIQKEKEMYDEGIQDSCKKCRPSCRQTKYTTSVTWSPLTQKHMALYRNKYKEQLINNETFSIVYVYFEMDSVQASRRSARYSTFEEVGLVGGTISMITGLTLLDIIEAIVVIAALIMAQHKIRTSISQMEFTWPSRIPRFTLRAPPPQEIIDLPVINVDHLDVQEIVEQLTIDVEPLEPQETVEPPIVISGQPGNPSPPEHPLENLPGFIV
ncbi:pickpocket protein 28 [Folsomia candida]|uniref:pickpocket protein 28 n=1 Tax=Folsomia candida TaxID=158441 RepID=UPI000B90083C|nr:pickpocket protein 28 [Folsomia candida]